MDFVLRIVFFLVIGAVSGALLTIAGKLFFVKTDETVEKITEALPGANCGGCGFAGCSIFAPQLLQNFAVSGFSLPHCMQ